jgi:hypothetical protein
MKTNVDVVTADAFYHVFKELEILNILESLRVGGSEALKAHDSVHEFMLLASLVPRDPQQVAWHQKSAFLTYLWEAFHSAHRATIEVLAGYYNAGFTLLRNTLELLVKGAFWECLAHEKFRDNARVLDEDQQKDRKRGSIKDWIDELIKRRPSIREEMEQTSASIFDKVATVFEDEDLQREVVRVPTFSTIVRQVIEWKIIDIPDAYNAIYRDLYNRLSKDVHVIPDKTDIGRRLLEEEDFLAVRIIPQELGKFVETLRMVMDIGIVIESNILINWLQREEARPEVKERLAAIKDLGLKLSSEKLRGLLRS